jgi:hypothetical protein
MNSGASRITTIRENLNSVNDDDDLVLYRQHIDE